ncbi:protoporphyrinogen oxidase [Paenibacillus sp. GCM10012307]|uniref:Coproporphyrinogen III oxidase n=1 Tax=Paenibacillus roseus TaxID=2798579 RepID=A0A934J1N7_9BACL|nr:protoporphyrinogen oxidase [Paenibacillus roseus]MBJ6359823.1 protoporphyrinogen oxidase [Paenibacillus roseus]
MRGTGQTDRIVIIGGGISGLSSAFYILRQARESGRKVQVTIVEEAPELGGKIDTLHKDGFVIEKGPDSFLARKRAIVDLARDLGIEQELTAQNPNGRKSFILHDGKLHPMPQGLMLGVPTDLDGLAATALMSESGKERVLQDLVLEAQEGSEDESVGGFLERRLGREAVQLLAEPLLAGIYAADLYKLSLRATFPQFREAELHHGSLIRGMQESRKASVAAAASNDLPEHVKGSMFLTFRGGLSALVDALDQALSDADRRLGVKASAIHKQPQDNGRVAYSVELASGERLEADAVVVTVPAFGAASLLRPLMDVSELEAVSYISVANVVLAFDKAEFGLQFDGSGFVIPRVEDRQLTACTWTSTKWLHTSPEDKVLLRCYLGRAGAEEVVELDDEQLLALVRREVKEIMDVDAKPLFAEITRLRHSMPQYPVGHVENVARLRKRAEEQLPGVWVTGAAFDGVGLPDCIRQGKEAAFAILESLH